MHRLKRKICVLTGTRAEYGLLRSLMRAIATHPDLELQLLVTGAHLVESFGHTIDGIRDDGFKVDVKIPMYRSADDVREALPAALGRLTDLAGKWLLANGSDFIVVLGDRVEALGGALAGLTANVPIAHLHGGELAAGDMDDRIRFAVSALASLHFVATPQAKNRLLRSGEPRDRIFVVGAMAMDEIFHARKQFADQSAFRRRYGFPDDQPVLIVLHHPCGYGSDEEYRQMTNILQTVKSYHGLIIGPNNDPGHSGIRRAIGEFLSKTAKQSKKTHWRYEENLSRDDFLEALWSSDLLVGNSSSGILEANALGTAVVNIGPRQQGRETNGNAVFSTSCFRREIRATISHALEFSKTHKIRSFARFGKGDAGATIAETLSRTPATRELLIKPRYQG